MKQNNNERGMSVIEVMFCAVIALAAIFMATNLLISGSQSTELSDLGARARISADDALATLRSQPGGNLSAGGSFVVIDSSTIEVTAPCSAATCDYITLDQSSETIEHKSPANGYSYDAMPSRVPANQILLRRWRIEDVDSELNLKRITVVVLTDKNSTFPLRIETAVIGLNR